MTGPLAMTRQAVNTVPQQAGAYVLGNNQNQALYIGRADANLRLQLFAHFGPPDPSAVVVSRFWYQVAANSWDAYVLECRWYHQFAPTHNAGHPPRPLGAVMGCPVCGR